MGTFWEDKRFLVTGGTGFLGSHVLRKLHDLGAKHINAPSSALYDLRSLPEVEKMYSEVLPDVVIHIAARVGGIGANQVNPATYFYDNLMMGLNVIDCAERWGIEKVVTVGTVCSYPKFATIPFLEDEIWNGYPEETNAPYGIAKKALLVMGQAYREQHGLNAIYVIPTNLYGPGDNFDLETSHVIPALIRKCLEAKNTEEPSIMVWGTGRPTREFLYVEDAAEGILQATLMYNSPEAVNLGSGLEVSIQDLVATIADLCGYEGQIAWDTSKPDGQPRRMVSTSRAEEAFGFKAQVPLREGIKRTIMWYMEQSLPGVLA